jgi:AcrR family transcriptional regulator
VTADESQPRAASTRARLLSAAAKAFAEKGFAATTTRDISLASGLSPAALYVHHKSKEELLYLISRSGHEETLRLIRAATNVSDDPSKRLRRLVYDFVLYHAREHVTARITNYEMGSLTPDHQAEIKKIRRKIDHEIQQVISAGIDAHQFRTSDPRMTAVALQSLGIDVARWFREHGPWTPEHIAERYADMALHLVGAQDDPSGQEGDEH